MYPFLPWDIAASKKFVLIIAKLFNAIGLNKKTKINTKLFTIVTVYFNVFNYVVYFKKNVLKLGNNNLFYSNKKNELGV